MVEVQDIQFLGHSKLTVTITPFPLTLPSVVNLIDTVFPITVKDVFILPLYYPLFTYTKSQHYSVDPTIVTVKL